MIRASLEKLLCFFWALDVTLVLVVGPGPIETAVVD